jgi:hypothetical protein
VMVSSMVVLPCPPRRGARRRSWIQVRQRI